ncbi:glycosyltransferase [Treponema sp. C6A8]|uniref:glycosyltransferase n=1 Tax=Treponema sp. C6A8 TaxID=1410609 RepID=UPI0004818215|nr:glycosyltransferase [Treponema sp. C6A8]
MENISINIAVIIVIYNPIDFGIKKILQNITSYKEYCDKLYIVDNSPADNSLLFSNLSNSVYLLNSNKGGIAGAQNLGCEAALKDGYQWAMTMDQDSFFEDMQIQTYIQLVNKYINTTNDAASFAPRIIDLNESKYWTHLLRKHILGPLKRKLLHISLESLPEITFPTEVIASANIINLPVWEKVGKFDEQLFIEQVDYDMCHNLIKNGYKIVKFNTVTLNQFFGKRVFALFKKNYPWYNNTRMYYVFRNLFIEKKRFPQYKNKYRKIIHMRFVDFCLNTIHPFSHFAIFFKAYKDSKKVW